MKVTSKCRRIVSAILCVVLLLLSAVPALAENYATVIGNGKVNLRKSATLASRVIGTCSPGTRVTVQSRGTVWSKVTVGQKTGYMMSKYLSSVKSNNVMYVRTYTGVKLRLREKPDVFSNILGAYKPGTAVNVLQRGSAWTKVSVDGMVGYMGSQYLSNTKP